MVSRAAILGAGSWGLAIAQLLHENNLDVMLWEFDADACERLLSARTQPDKLGSFALPTESNPSDVFHIFSESSFLGIPLFLGFSMK